MNSNDAAALCEKLCELVEGGHHAYALPEALGIVRKLSCATAPLSYVHGKLVDIGELLPRWFSDKKWDTKTDPGGLRIQGDLRADIDLVRESWEPKMTGVPEP
jgi:hypothetical protein